MALACAAVLAGTVFAGCSSTAPVWPSLLTGRQGMNGPPSTRTMIVVDIDETLSHTKYFDLLFRTGRDKSRPLRGAQEALTRLAGDYDIIYLTCRPTYLFQDTRGWLVANGFPDAPLHTANQVLELLSVRRYKTRHLADLRERYPNALIGIGDRDSDGLAYQANDMISIIVNPNEECNFNSRDVVLRSWADVDAFFKANGDLLEHPDKIRSAAQTERFVFDLPNGIELVRHDVDDSKGRRKLNRALLRAFPKLREDASHQAGGAQALQDNCRLTEAVTLITAEWPEARLVGVRLGMTGGNSVVQVQMIVDEQLMLAVLSASDGQQLHVETHPINPDLARMTTSSTGQQISFLRAIEIAANRVDGQPYSIEMRREYNRPTYEVSLLCRRAFWEVDVDAATGRLQEVDHEWRLVPLN